MGCACHKNNETAQANLRLLQRSDPTRTFALRDRFAQEMRRRFKALTIVIRQSVDTNDAFGLDQTRPRQLFQAAAVNRQFAFPTSAQKVEAFMDWLREQNQEFILSGGAVGTSSITRLGRPGALQPAWTDVYLESAYQTGIRRARAELRKAGVDIPELGDSIVDRDRDAVEIAFNQPQHADRAGIVFTRAFAELKGVTAIMEQQIARVLAQGLIDGKNPRDLARMLVKVITGEGGDLGVTDVLGRYIPARRRAELIARTEIIRAHHLANIQEYRNAGVLGVVVKAEWTTAGDGRVCPDCDDLEGRIFTLDEIEFMIPLHPQCRCIGLPVVVEQVAVLVANGFKMSIMFANTMADDYNKSKEASS